MTDREEIVALANECQFVGSGKTGCNPYQLLCRAADALRSAARTGRDAAGFEAVAAIIEEKMLDAWNDICSDTGSHPLDIKRSGRALDFRPDHWSRLTARSAATAIAGGLRRCREDIAEAMWRAELRRATGKERNIPWSEVSETDQQRWLYVADAAIAALPAPATASAGWQDIETAPKDTPIWAWGDNWHWREGNIGFPHSDYNGHKGVVCFGGRAGPPFSIGSENAPTHWMPLPAAPTITR